MPENLYLTALLYVRGRVSTEAGGVTLCNVEESGEQPLALSARVYVWPELPEGAWPSPVAVNPQNPGEALWLVRLPKSTFDFFTRASYRDVRDLMSLYTRWTGMPAPEDWLSLPAFELSA